MNVHDLTETDRRMIRMHCDWLRRRGATDRTVHHRRENLRRFALRLPVPMLDATHAHLDDWQSGLHCSKSSIATYTNHVVGFYRWAAENEHVERDPSNRLPRPKIARREPRPIPDEDLQIALDAAHEPIYTWLMLAAGMGLRAMEVANIRHEDVTEVRGRTWISGIGKGGKPFRLAVPDEVLPALRPHLGRARVGPVFRRSDGVPVRPRDVTDQVARFFQSIGMRYTLHWLRHYFGTEAHREKGDLLLTMTLMRHESADTTRNYVQQIPAEAIAVMDQMAKRLRPKARRPYPPRPEAA